MDFADLITSISLVARESDDSALTRLCQDSRAVNPGDVFVAVRGVHVDGHDFIAEAISRGASAVVTDHVVDIPPAVEQVVVPDTARALGELAQCAAGSPADQMAVLGVTGTNGKTTVAFLTRAMLEAAGRPCGMIGTIAYDTGGKTDSADNTTPDALKLANLMHTMRRNGLQAAVMECSSHGLHQRRTAGITFDAAAFTNLTGDHRDYHGTCQAYLEAKSRLFVGLAPDAVAVLNAQDPATTELIGATHARIWRYAVELTSKNDQQHIDDVVDRDSVQNAYASAGRRYSHHVHESVDIRGRIDTMGLWGTDVQLDVLGEAAAFRFPLLGTHNVSNLLAAVGLARAAGVSLDAVVKAAAGFAGVPGRLECVAGPEPFSVLVDYAHTDDALGHVLRAVRELKPRRVILVFGCGGDRDRTKRPRMARIAQQWADHIVVTNDNPRTESPQGIIDDIRSGFSQQTARRVVELPDRHDAIAHALTEAQCGDVVLIAGKGHEDYQIIGSQRLSFDDRQVAREILAAGNRLEYGVQRQSAHDCTQQSRVTTYL